MFLMFRDTILEVVSLAEYFKFITDENLGLRKRFFEANVRDYQGKNAVNSCIRDSLEVEWCACFVSWCGEQAGLIESGAMPKFSLCENGIDWFKSHGKWQETGGIPSAGSLVFFDWNGDGISDHVGIVEKYEGGIIYTVEGNTGTNIGGNNVRGVWEHSYSVGSATILGYGII